MSRTSGRRVYAMMQPRIAGALIPPILKWLATDPASASGIFLTTASDVARMGIFLSVSTLLLL